MIKIGQGVDAHIFSVSGELSLGLIKIPQHNKLSGHSDGDVIAHSIVDALLSSCQKGDIGTVFGVNNAETKDVASELFIKEALRIIKPFVPTNINVTVITSVIKVSKFRLEMEKKLSAVCGCPVSIIATTTDDFLENEKDGILVISNCLVKD